MADISVWMSRKGGSKDDAANASKGRKPETGGVTGQATTISIICWNCWAVNEIVWPGPGLPDSFVCWNCGISGTI